MEDSTIKRQDRIALGSFLLLLVGLLYVSYKMVAPYLMAVLMGAILAILSRNLYVWVQTKGPGPKVSAATVTFGVWLLIVVPIGVFAMLAVTQGIEVARHLVDQPVPSLGNFSAKISSFKPLSAMVGDAAQVEKQIREGLRGLAAAAPGVLFKLFGGIPETILQFFLGMLSCYFLLLDGATFLRWLRDKLPLDANVRGAVFHSFRDTAVTTTVATLTAASVQSIIIVTGFLLLGAPVAFLAGGITFVLAWVPLVGSTPVWVGAALMFFLKGATLKGFLMLGVGGLTGISDNLVYPLVLKGRGEMHPLVSLVAIFGGIQMFGIFGVFVGPILAALLISTLNLWPVIAERFGILKACQIVTTPNQTLEAASGVTLPPSENKHAGLILPPGLGEPT